MNNKKKCINIIAYIIVVILAVFYLATLVLGSKLDVSDEYKLYYVDGELSKWPGENGLDYYFGNTEIYDISKLEEYKKLLEEQKLYGDIITDDEEEAEPSFLTKPVIPSVFMQPTEEEKINISKKC